MCFSSWWPASRTKPAFEEDRPIAVRNGEKQGRDEAVRVVRRRTTRRRTRDARLPSRSGCSRAVRAASMLPERISVTSERAASVVRAPVSSEQQIVRREASMTKERWSTRGCSSPSRASSPSARGALTSLGRARAPLRDCSPVEERESREPCREKRLVDIAGQAMLPCLMLWRAVERDRGA